MATIQVIERKTTVRAIAVMCDSYGKVSMINGDTPEDGQGTISDLYMQGWRIAAVLAVETEDTLASVIMEMVMG